MDIGYHFVIGRKINRAGFQIYLKRMNIKSVFSLELDEKRNI